MLADATADIFATTTNIVITDPSPSPTQRYYRILQRNFH